MNEYVYLYDGSFICLLNLSDYLIKNNIRPVNIKRDDYFPNLLEKTINLEIKINERIINDMIKIMGNIAFKLMYNVFLSDQDNKELIIFYFYLNSLKYQEKIIYMRNLKCVREVLRISRYVSNETHKYKGFVRFKELKNKVLYAEIEPVSDILFMLSIHFQKRLKNEYWIIKDVKRDILSVYDKNNFVIVGTEEFKLINSNISDDEEVFADLWKKFYKTIGIKERKNDRCRMNFMPKKYWKYMLEVSEEL